MVDYIAHVKRPFQDLKTLVIGCGLGFLKLVQLIPLIGWIFVIPIDILISGFSLKSADNFIKGNKSLAQWNFDSLIDMIVKSLMAGIVTFVYLLPAIILAIVFGVSAIISFASQIGALQGGAITSAQTNEIMGLLARLGLAAVFALIAHILLPIAIMHMLKNGFGAAFHFKTILKKVFTIKYAIAEAFAFGYFLVWLIISVVLISFVPFVGIVIAYSFLWYIVPITLMPMYAETYNEIQ